MKLLGCGAEALCQVVLPLLVDWRLDVKPKMRL